MKARLTADSTIFPKRGRRETAQDHAPGLLSGHVRPDFTNAVSRRANHQDQAGDVEKTMAKLSQLGRRHLDQHRPKFVVENRFEWAFGKKVIRGLGVIDKGGPHETPIEAFLGPDPVNNTVYYLDCHGGTSVFKGTVKLEGEDLIFEFATIVGKPATWREVLQFTDKDTMQFTIFSQKDDQWVPVVKQTSKRKQPRIEYIRAITEGMMPRR